MNVDRKRTPIETAQAESEVLKGLSVTAPSPENQVLHQLLLDRKVRCEHALSLQAAERMLLDSPFDLVILDADHAEGDLAGFLDFCGRRHLGIPIVAIHGGTLLSRSASLIRMGAFDSFPRDLDRWNAVVFLDRAVAQARITKALLRLSRTDHLTGLFNQRFLHEAMEREMLRARRLGRSLSVALFAMDDFKSFNDTYGHLEGDRTLGRVGERFSSSIRGGQDAAFRYGGDEFLLLLPEATPSEAVRVVERVLAAFREEFEGKVSFSVGITNGEWFPDVAAAMRAADTAMYQSKEAGGDRITIHTYPFRP